MDIDFLNYCADYKPKNKKRETHACFASLMNGPERNSVSIFLYLDINIIEEESKNNFCPFNINEITFYLNYIKEFVSFKYSIITHENEYELKVSYNLNKMGRKFLLTSIRYLFEFPFNIYLLDAFDCKKTKKFPFLNFFNLIILVQNTSNIYYPSIHSLGCYNSSFRANKKVISKRLKKEIDVNVLFPIRNKKYIELPEEEFESFDEYNKHFNFRLTYYLDNFKGKTI